MANPFILIDFGDLMMAGKKKPSPFTKPGSLLRDLLFNENTILEYIN